MAAPPPVIALAKTRSEPWAGIIPCELIKAQTAVHGRARNRTDLHRAQIEIDPNNWLERENGSDKSYRLTRFKNRVVARIPISIAVLFGGPFSKITATASRLSESML